MEQAPLGISVIPPPFYPTCDTSCESPKPRERELHSQAEDTLETHHEELLVQLAHHFQHLVQLSLLIVRHRNLFCRGFRRCLRRSYTHVEDVWLEHSHQPPSQTWRLRWVDTTQGLRSQCTGPGWFHPRGVTREQMRKEVCSRRFHIRWIV
jgi:hypothetical protein